MNNTTHFNLKKPEGSDYYNIQDFNDNADILDEKLFNTKDSTTQFTSGDVADGSANSWTVVAPLVSDETHASIFNKVSNMFKNIRYLYKFIGTTSIANIGNGTITGGLSFVDEMIRYSHNTHKRCKDITSYFTDGTLWNRISGEGYPTPYWDIFAGDYIDMGRNVTAPNQDSQYAVTGSRYVTVLGCGTLYGTGDTGITYEHLVMAPGKGEDGDQHFGRKRMNSSHTTNGGYVGSEMNNSTIGAVTNSGSIASGATINQQLYYIFNSHLKTVRALLSNAINSSGYNRFGTNSGCSNNWAWTSVQACLMSEVEVYGSSVWDSSGYDTGEAKVQMPLFRMSTKALNNRSGWYWLRGVASASHFCGSNTNGNANCNDAGNTNNYVRPRFVIA